MNKVTELLDAVGGVITCVRNLADSLQESVLQAVIQLLLQISYPQEYLLPPEDYLPGYELEDVRGVLAEKSQNGLTSEVKGLIAKFGGSKLSDIDPSNYEAIIKEAEVLGNE